MTKVKNIVITATYLVLLFSLAVGMLVMPDKDVSTSERRPLTQFSTYSEQKDKAEGKGEKYGPAEYFAYLEDYMLDQFPARDLFRSIKSVFKKYVLFQPDNNGYYMVGGHLAKMDETLNEKALNDSLARFNSLYNRLFKPLGANAYYSIIPDKNYFTAEQSGHLHYDYDKMYELIAEKFSDDIKEIVIKDKLTLDDYYTTDPHWDQKHILPVADALLTGMGADRLASELTWAEHALAGYMGTYYGQAALPIDKDTLTYLTAPELDNVTVLDLSTNKETSLYDEENFTNKDPYDVFLDGAMPLFRITNPDQKNGKQLVIFRDSFGSSMVPLLVSEYSEVLVVDIRYVSPSILDRMVKFQKGCDVLFLYSTSVLNTYGAFMN